MLMHTSSTRRITGAVIMVLGIAALVFSFAASSSAQESQFDITLYGENEVPPVFTDATGSANVQLQADGLHYSLTASGSQFTMGHIHYGAAGQPAGPIVVWLFNAMDDPQSTVNASGVITVDDLEGPFEGDWDGFLAALASGHLNINVHSTTYPAGELRAQIYPQWGATLSAEEETAEVDSDATGSFSMSTDAVVRLRCRKSIMMPPT
jgi:hypothetical protein